MVWPGHPPLLLGSQVMTDTGITLRDANAAFRAACYAEALALYDILAREQPRNFWLRLNAVMACLRARLPAEAARRLEAIDRSPQIGDDVLSSTRAVVQQRLRDAGSVPRLYGPTDYLQWQRTSRRLAPLRRLRANKSFPSGYPFELELPALHGNGNDYRFIVDVVNRSRATGRKSSAKILVVVFASAQDDVDHALALLASQSFAHEQLEVLFVAVNEPEWPTTEHAFRSSWLPYDRGQPVAQINQAIAGRNADLVVFLPPGVDHNPWLLEQLSHCHDVTDLAVFAFHTADAASPDALILDRFDAGASINWRGERYGFRKVGAGNLVVSAACLRRVQGFAAELFSLETAFRELGYRLYLDGAYFMPAPAECHITAASRKAWVAHWLTSTPTERFEDYCAGHWWRKQDGRYPVPKVSVYIPSYNNSAYIVQSVQSVLDQDFEVCICDDGSTDDTLMRLQHHFGHEPRVRVLAGANGGIGAASNRAVAMARGMYIGQLDSDDLLKPGALARMAAFLDDNPVVGCAYASCERVDAHGQHVKAEYSFPVFSREKMMMTSIAHHFRMFRRQSWARTEGFREDIVNAVDYDMFLKLAEVTTFHHIDEVLYQRRWHGNNTSLVNEGAQSANTLVVLNKSLNRQGLQEFWAATAPDPTYPRKITYRRHQPTTRVFFWPDYSAANPYQCLLYSRLDERFDVLSGDLQCALKAITDQPAVGPVVFHLHWTNTFFKPGGGAEVAKEAIAAFEAQLATFKQRGGHVVWTIHNAVSHDNNQHAELERDFMCRLAIVADRIHMHCAGSFAELNLDLSAASGKVFVVPHGSYAGHYPDYVTRADARRHLGFDEKDFVLLFTGQVRPYKGLERLLEAFAAEAAGKSWHLLVAGKASADFAAHLATLVPQAIQDRVTILNGFVDDHALQLLYRSADLAVFPYERILTSGSALLSMSFGVAPILPRVAMVEELLEGGRCGFIFDPQDTTDLRRVLAEAYAAHLRGELVSMNKAARQRAESLAWHGVDDLLCFSA